MSVQCEIICENLISLHRCKKILRGKYLCVHMLLRTCPSGYICFCIHVHPMDIVHQASQIRWKVQGFCHKRVSERVRRLTKKSTYISHTDLNKKHDRILKYNRHGSSHMFLHSFVKDNVVCDERRREPTFEKIRFFERQE